MAKSLLQKLSDKKSKKTTVKKSKKTDATKEEIQESSEG
tara:strand:+ start:278 stop:394 length:117 start_codon:yes stop_codon:yes gene_type:complete